MPGSEFETNHSGSRKKTRDETGSIFATLPKSQISKINNFGSEAEVPVPYGFFFQPIFIIFTGCRMREENFYEFYELTVLNPLVPENSYRTVIFIFVQVFKGL